MKRKADFTKLLDRLRRTDRLTQTLEETLLDYWTREEYTAAENVVDNIFLSMAKSQIDTTIGDDNIDHHNFTMTINDPLDTVIKGNPTAQTKQRRSLPDGRLENYTNCTFNKDTQLDNNKWINETPSRKTPPRNITSVLDRLQPFKGQTSTELRIWLRRFELAITLAHATEDEEHRSFLKYIFLGDYLQGKALNLYRGAEYALEWKEDYNATVDYILARLDTPVNQLRANQERLRFLRGNVNITDHFNDFIKKTMATCGITENILMGNVTEQEATRNPSKRSDRAFQTLIKIEFLYTLPRRIAEQMEQTVMSSTIMELREQAEELLIRDKEKRNRVNKQEGFPIKYNKDHGSHSTHTNKTGFRGTKINTINSIDNMNTKLDDTLSDNEQQVHFQGPIVPRIFVIKPRQQHQQKNLIWTAILMLGVLFSGSVGFMQFLDCDQTDVRHTWAIASPRAWHCEEIHQWHLELRNIYTLEAGTCKGNPSIIAVSPKYTLIVKELPQLLMEIPGRVDICNKTLIEFSKGYALTISQPIWAREEIGVNVTDSIISFPTDMSLKMRGLAIQSLLYKGQGLITQLTSQEWRALFINMFEQHYVDDRNLNILRTKIFSLIQQRILPLYTEACRRSQAEYVAITHTKDPSEKMRIFLNRRDIRASFVENHYIIQKCIDVDPEAIFSDYRYNSTCYPLMPILVKRALKFVDKDGYIRQYAQGIPCIQDTSTASSSEQDEESNNFVINFDSFWDRVIWFVSHGSDILGVLKFFLFSIGGVIGTIVVLFGIWKCYVGVRKIKTWYTKRCVRKRHRNNIKQKMEKIIELSSLQQRQVNSIGSAHGKQTCLDLYIRIKDRQQVVRCLLDSGACLSFINKSVIRECTELQNFAMPTKIAEDFNGNPILAIGKCKIPFIMGAKSVYLPFWILESLNPDVLLGADALEYLDQANCTVSFKLASNTIQIGSVKHPLASISRVAFLSPGDIWKSAKAWLWQIRQLSQETDQLMDELRIVDLEVPEELTKDLAIWEMLPDNHTLRHIDLTGTQFSTIGQTRLRALLHKYATAFIQHEHDIGRYNGHIQHTIHLKADAKLPAAGVPRHSPKTKDSAKTLIDNMLQQGIIQSSTSRCTSRYLLVPKPNGTDRFVVDYRQLNMNSHMEIPCIPHIEDILNTVCQFNWFSVFDVASGFHQIPLHPKCRWLTAFNSPWGVYEYITTPMGLSGSPGTFQRIMDHLFWDLKSSILIYIDDIIIFSADEDSHMKTITIFLQRITEAGLKLRLDKSRFGVKELKYLGFLISANGISPDPEKLSIIQNLPPPKDLRHLRGFLGMMNFFRRFIRNYAVITAPLCELLKKGVIFHWSTLCQDAFDTLIKCLMNAPILSPPIPNGEFLLYTDASYTGLGAVLLQKQPELRVITYLSRSINAFERNYPPIHLEALAIVWALAQIDHFIIGMPITIFTDHQPLLALFGSKTLQGKLARYQLRLMQYQATIKYQPGKENVVADYLSRYSVSTVNYITAGSFPWHNMSWSYTDDELSTLSALVDQQKAKEINGKYYKWSPQEGLGGLFPTGGKRDEYLTEFHKHPMLGGHFGWEKVKSQLLQFIFWNNIEEDYKRLCKECFVCQTQKTIPYQLIKHKTQKPMVGNVPLGKIYMDLLQPGRRTSSGYIAAIVAVDSLTRFVMTGLLTNLSAEEVIKSILENIIFKYGVPKQIITDRGTCFSGEEFEKFTKSMNISHHLNSANHHQSNGMVERMNRTLNEAIRIYNNQEWDHTVVTNVFCYNNTIHPKTGLTPSYLMFGRHSNMHLTKTNIIAEEDYNENKKQWEDIIQGIQKNWYDVHHTSWKAEQPLVDFKLNVQINDLVLRKRITDKRGKKSPWSGPYQIISLDKHQRALIKKGRQEMWIHVSQLKKYESEKEKPFLNK